MVRGFRATEHCTAKSLDGNGLPKQSVDAVPLLNALYNCLRTNRQQRRSFLSGVVRMFSDDYAQELTLEEVLFIADNLATFPYQLLDEPLYLIHAADGIISLSGQNVLVALKTMLIPKRPGELNDEEEEFKPDNLFRRLPEDMTQIYNLMNASQSCFLLLHIKTYLMKLFRLTNAKVHAYSASEAAKVYEKPIIRQNIPIFGPDLTLQALHPDVIKQRNTVEGNFNLCQRINYFRTMFYSLDIHDNAEDDDDADFKTDCGAYDLGFC